jgi:hypothetical protein
MSAEHECVCCGGAVHPARWALGRHTCLPCGEASAQQERKGWTVAPMPKSNYILITDPALLKGLNSSHKGART